MRKLLMVLLAGMVLSASPMALGEGDATKAINFQFTDISGRSIQLSDFKGKWVLVNFWAPWCPLCWVEVPALNELNKRKDFVVIGISLDYGPDENIVRESAQRHNLDFHAIVAGGSRRNPDSPFRQVGPVDFYPTSYLYDPNGEIVMFIPGQVKTNKVMAFMDGWGSKKNVQLAGSDIRRSPALIAMPASQPALIPASVNIPRNLAPELPATKVAYGSKAVNGKAAPAKEKSKTKAKTANSKAKSAKSKAKAKRAKTPLKNRKTIIY